MCLELDMQWIKKESTRKVSMQKIALIHIIALTLSLISCRAEAFGDYEVDWPTSVSGQSHTLRITIDGCTTLFKIKDGNLEKFSKSKDSLKEVTAVAIKRSKNGCKD